MPILNIINDDGTSQTAALYKATTSIGRDKDNDLSLSDRTISRHHAQITSTKEGYILTDLGSYNGTSVNGNPIQSLILKHNDRIKIGVKNLVFLDEKERGLSPEESLVLTTDADFEEEHKQIFESFSQGGSFDSQELLVPIEEIHDIDPGFEMVFGQVGFASPDLNMSHPFVHDRSEEWIMNSRFPTSIVADRSYGDG